MTMIANLEEQRWTNCHCQWFAGLMCSCKPRRVRKTRSPLYERVRNIVTAPSRW
jgi:hypothetical protein